MKKFLTGALMLAITMIVACMGAALTAQQAPPGSLLDPIALLATTAWVAAGMFAAIAAGQAILGYVHLAPYRWLLVAARLCRPFVLRVLSFLGLAFIAMFSMARYNRSRTPRTIA